MKNKITRTLLSLLATTAAFSAPDARAANVTLDGSGYYTFNAPARYYAWGADQSGRYSKLGADYYRSTTISMQWITNRSTSKSGPLSFELWGMPFYGADAGVVMMTRSVFALKGGKYYFEKRWTGASIFLDEVRFPEFSLWEYRPVGWRFRDALSFRRSNLL